MKLLLDECVDQRLRLLFSGHECPGARYANLAGLKNGSLLDAAEAAGFDVLMSVPYGDVDQRGPASTTQRKGTRMNRTISSVRLAEVHAAGT